MCKGVNHLHHPRSLVWEAQTRLCSALSSIRLLFDSLPCMCALGAGFASPKGITCSVPGGGHAVDHAFLGALMALRWPRWPRRWCHSEALAMAA